MPTQLSGDVWRIASRRRQQKGRVTDPGKGAYMGDLYHTTRWRALRVQRLTEDPLCCMCLRQGKLSGATVVDHIKPHRGDERLFFDYANTQSLCKMHHDATKQREEERGYSNEVGADGWPTDPKHPANRASRP